MAAYNLDTLASVLKFHPRTLLSILQHDRHWHRNYNPVIDYADVELTLGTRMTEKIFNRCLKGKDEVLTTKQLSEILGLSEKVVTKRAYPTIIGLPYRVRYLRSRAMERHVIRYVDNPAVKRDFDLSATRKNKQE